MQKTFFLPFSFSGVNWKINERIQKWEIFIYFILVVAPLLSCSKETTTTMKNPKKILYQFLILIWIQNRQQISWKYKIIIIFFLSPSQLTIVNFHRLLILYWIQYNIFTVEYWMNESISIFNIFAADLIFKSSLVLLLILQWHLSYYFFFIHSIILQRNHKISSKNHQMLSFWWDFRFFIHKSS